MELDGKRTLITGAARGLGLAMAELFTERGAHVAIADVDRATAEQAAASIGSGTIALACDVTRAEDVQRAIAAAAEAFGGLDVMVNNAGIEIAAPLPETDDAAFGRLFDINVKGVFFGIKYAVPELAKTRGTILNMASAAGVAGVPLLGGYAATKAAVISLSQTAAIELRDFGIRVNALCPSFIKTEMVDRLVAPFEAATGVEFGALAQQAQGRLGTPEEVAELAAFLASDDASFITGAHYLLDNALAAAKL
jgi:NAD(P)-dependent dehydrogenase (short-subunit alcohol dehydrogenase family)